jgi:NAD(P)-dependent dehydrogenase (short-subunit alcohol dehydrogenase family)
MAKVFITGSSDGLGQLAAKQLVKGGHEVVLHARNSARAKEAEIKVAGAQNVLVADLGSISEIKTLAQEVNSLGAFDAIIHNAGIYNVSENARSADGLPLLFAVNSVAPYLLTCLIKRPKRLIYVSSDMHLSADAALNNLEGNEIRGRVSYSDTKYHDLILAMAVAESWKDVYSNALNPGWVPTKMGGAGAPDNLEKGYETQVWLTTSNEPAALSSGHYFFHKKQSRYLKSANDKQIQEKLLGICEYLTGVPFK